MSSIRIVFYVIVAYCVQSICSSWIDPDTDSSSHTISSLNDNRQYNLIFSDEFNINNRKFYDGDDPKWTAIHKNDYTNFALHYYNHDLVTTNNGSLNISTIIRDITFDVQDTVKVGKRKMTKNYQSAMVQGWNKFCFTNGIVEIRAKLPGNGYIGGFWPAIWLLGNLARATYVSSSNNVWPWSYDECNKNFQEQQLFSACNVVNHFALNKFQGRGAPEIDVFEVMPGYEQLFNTPINKPYLSTSLQVAPAIQDYRPVDAFPPSFEQWYNHGLDYGLNASLNIFFYGMYLKGIYEPRSYLADAISANTNIDDSYFTDYHDYRLEWQNGENGYIKWYIDGVFRYGIDANALNITGAQIPSEPMYLILNNAISSHWGFPIPCPEGCPCDCFDARREECHCAIPSRMMENFPAYFLIDYIRVYQDTSDSSHTIGCSTRDYPTRRYIQAHKQFYTEDDNNNVIPLQPIMKGGGHCMGIKEFDYNGDYPTLNDILLYSETSNPGSLECGYGYCWKKKCHCHDGYTGPTCKTAIGFNDIDLDPDDDHMFLSWFLFPSSLLLLSSILFILCLGIVFYKYYEDQGRGSWRLTRRSSYSAESLIKLVETSIGSILRPSRREYQSIPPSSYGVDGISSIHHGRLSEDL